MTHSAPETPSAQPWTDAFPWLRAIAGLDANESDPRWAEPIAASTEPQQHQAAREIAKLAIHYRPASYIATIFPRLPADLSLQNLDLPARQKNVLRKHGLHTASDLATVTVELLLNAWSVGPRVLEGIFTALVEESLAVTMSGAAAE